MPVNPNVVLGFPLLLHSIKERGSRIGLSMPIHMLARTRMSSVSSSLLSESHHIPIKATTFPSAPSTNTSCFVTSHEPVSCCILTSFLAIFLGVADVLQRLNLASSPHHHHSYSFHICTVHSHRLYRSLPELALSSSGRRASKCDLILRKFLRKILFW